MKATLCAVLALAVGVCPASGQTWLARQRIQAAQNQARAARAAQQRLQAEAKAWTNAQAAAAALAESNRLANLPPEDPWRFIDGAQVAANGPGWFRFWGRVQGVREGAMLIHGSYSKGGSTNEGNFVLVRFPETRTEGDTFTYKESWWAKLDGTTNFEGADYRRLDYGELRLTDEEKAAQARAMEEKRAKAMATTIAYYQQRADKGDPDAWLRLGEIYRDGDGVPKDAARAREYLAKAAAQGNQDAQKELDRLP